MGVQAADRAASEACPVGLSGGADLSLSGSGGFSSGDRVQAGGEQRLALLGAFTALGLGLAEQFDNFLVVFPFGVVDEGFHP
jgi:hypothetical protein